MSTSTSAPYTRSRTNLFLSYRDSVDRSTSASYLESLKAGGLGGGGGGGTFSRKGSYVDGIDDEESRGLIGGMEETVLDMGTPSLSSNGRSGRKGKGGDVLPPKWVDLADRIDEVVEKIKPKILHLDKLHAKHVLPGFKDRSAEEREIDAVANDITRDFRSCQKYIRQVAELSKAMLTRAPGQRPPNRTDLIMAANVQTALATKVQELSTVFRKKQTAYLRQLKGYESKSSQSSSSPVTSAGVFSRKDPLASLADDERYSQSQLQSTSMRSAQADFTQRDQEITAIAQSITDLSDLFKDLSSMVIDQGTLLDRVDYNVEQMGGDVKAAAEELKVATTYQRRSAKCQMIFFLVLLIAGCLIVIAYRPRSGSQSSTPSPEPNPTPDSDLFASDGVLKGRRDMRGADFRNKMDELVLGTSDELSILTVLDLLEVRGDGGEDDEAYSDRRRRRPRRRRRDLNRDSTRFITHHRGVAQMGEKETEGKRSRVHKRGRWL